MKGEDVLRVLVELERDRRQTSPLAGVAARAIARQLGGRDGRAVTATLKRLDQQGSLVRRPEGQLTLPRWETTERGREVIRLLDGFKANGWPSGGLLAAGFSYYEAQALQR